MSKQVKKYDIYTLGNSPAAIYLVDVLNSTTNKIDHNILRHIHSFKTKFNQIVKAFENHHLDYQVVVSFINGQILELENQAHEWKKRGYTTLVVNLGKNLIISNYTQFKRQQGKINKIKNSATQRAKSMLKNADKSYANQEISTYGKEADEKTLNVVVKFNEHGLPSVTLDTNLVRDSITNEHLMQKSLKRLNRLGKRTDLYKDLQK